MEQLFLKPEIVSKIKADPILQAKVAVAMGASLQTIYRALAKENNPRLTQINVLLVIKDHLNIKKESDLLTPVMAAA